MINFAHADSLPDRIDSHLMISLPHYISTQSAQWCFRESSWHQGGKDKFLLLHTLEGCLMADWLNGRPSSLSLRGATDTVFAGLPVQEKLKTLACKHSQASQMTTGLAFAANTPWRELDASLRGVVTKKPTTLGFQMRDDILETYLLCRECGNLPIHPHCPCCAMSRHPFLYFMHPAFGQRDKQNEGTEPYEPIRL